MSKFHTSNPRCQKSPEDLEQSKIIVLNSKANNNLYVFFIYLQIVFYYHFRFHADSSPGLITNKSNQTENEVYPSEEQDTIGARYYLSTGKENPFCRKF